MSTQFAMTWSSDEGSIGTFRVHVNFFPSQEPAEQVDHLLQETGKPSAPFMILHHDSPGIGKILQEQLFDLAPERSVVDDAV